MQPTNEQLKKFWEWCGFWEVDYIDVAPIRYGKFGERECFEKYPPLDPNSLFKYAMKKLNDPIISFYKPVLGGRSWVCKLSVMGRQHIGAADDDPVTAIFWAIYEIIEEKINE